MKPFYFNDCFAWLHDAAGSRGVVICSAMGLEELCTHRFMRHLADDLAAAGMPTLRFDYQGTGNSVGGDRDPGRVAQWVKSIHLAVDALKEQTGVTEVALIGFRLGALLATAAASESGDAAKLVLLGPVASGKAYIRETRALAALVSQSARESSESAPMDSGFEVAGFPISAQTIDDLKQLDTMALTKSPAHEVLILGRANAGADERLEKHLLSIGCAVTRGELPGYAQLEWNTNFDELPSDAFGEVVRWLGSGADATPRIAVSSIAPVQELSSASWIECPVNFGHTDSLFGIHTAALHSLDVPDRQIVLFVNHGANHHIGWARLHVTLARRFANFGIDSLRMDISGVGDSPAHAGYPENLLYARHTQLDVRAAVDWIKQKGYARITVIGHCAGAHLGFYSTLRDTRINSLVMLNLQRFFWARNDTLRAAVNQGFRASSWYWSKLRDRGVWWRLVRGQVNAKGIALVIFQRVMQRSIAAAASTLGPLFGGDGLSGKVARWLRELSVRGTRVLMVYSAGDGGLDELFTHLGSKAKRIGKLNGLQLVVIDGADHNMTPAWAQEEYGRILETFLKKD